MFWDLRDDTGSAGPSNVLQQQLTLARKGKTRKSDPQDPAAPLPEKKPRKKWTPEETQMLVEGCNRVCNSPQWAVKPGLTCANASMA